MIYTTGTIAINGNTVTGTGTNFSAPLSLIRVGCTLIAIGNQVQIFTVTEIKSGTELSVTPAANPAIPAGTKFSILLSDSISVDGLAQDVAETLRYYQGKETEIATAVEWWNEFGGDGQMEQLLADIRAETAQSTANAQKTESDKNAAAASKTAAANSATAAKASQDAAKASETAASNSKTAAATSATNAAKSAADALNYRNQAQGIVGTSIGLGSSPRDCPDISGEPSGYIGFIRIRGGATGFPSIASGDEVLTGFISVRDTTPTYSGVFVGWVTRSLYTYEWSPQSGPQWSRHARKDEVSRLSQGSGESALWAAGGKQKFVLCDGGTGNSIDWGVYDNQQGKWCPLKVAQGGTGAVDVDTAKKNLGIPYTGMGHWVDYAAPAGAEATKYYPVGITHPSHFNGDFLIEVAMRTKSVPGNESPNCNAIHLWMRDAGWSDNGKAVFGHYHCYASDEVAILCVRGTDKGQYQHNVVYVRGDAFPIRMATTVGCTVTIPTADWKPVNRNDSPTYKWGITNSLEGVDPDTYGIASNLLDFTSGLSGFYCTDTYRNKYGNRYLVIQPNGIIQPPNGLGTHSDQDWNAQQSDGVNKFKPIAGNLNTPESSLTYGGFHVGFSGTHATQFAGRNSKFFARSFEGGVDKGWCQLATLNASSQRWTGYQQFKSTGFFSDTYTRKVTLAVANSAVRNGELYLWGAESRPTVFECRIKDPDTNALLSWIFCAQQNTDDSCLFQVNGAVNCVTVTQSSDRDLKDNIQVIGDATEAIRKMNGYTYTLKENGLPYAGVIAQEVMEALPEAVGSFTHYGEALQGPTVDGNELREETRYLNVDYAAVTGLLVQVARETDNRVTELEEENASLRANIAVMDERITKLEALVRQLTGSEK